MSVFGVILVRIQSECEKIQTRITPNMDIFHTVSAIRLAGNRALINLFILKVLTSFGLLFNNEFSKTVPEEKRFTSYAMGSVWTS